MVIEKFDTENERVILFWYSANCAETFRFSRNKTFRENLTFIYNNSIRSSDDKYIYSHRVIQFYGFIYVI